MSDRCVFCKIIKGKIPAHKVYEDHKALAFLDIHPSTVGHTLIIPKAHITRVEDLPEEDARALFAVLHKLVDRIQKAVDSPASTIGINNGRESGQEVPHVHIHVIPRYRGDRGGIIQGITRGVIAPRKWDLATIADRIREEVADIKLRSEGKRPSCQATI